MSDSNQGFTSSTSYTSFSSSETVNGQTTSSHYAHGTHSDPSGTTTYRAAKEPGSDLREELETRPSDRTLGGSGSGQGRIEDVTDQFDADGDQQARNDRVYEERMEEEYAKREGGA